MKRNLRKYILIVLTFLTILLCTVGVSTWIILSKQEVQPIAGFTKIDTTATVSATKIYYGQNATITPKITAIQNGKTIDVTKCFTAVCDTTTLTASGAKGNLQTTATVSFKYSNNLYKYSYNLPADQTVTVKLNEVALYKSSDTETYYSTIDDALAAANSAGSGTVYSLPLGNNLDTESAKKAKTISTTTEIKSGVTLRLPYTDKTDTTTENIDTVLSYVKIPSSTSTTYTVSSFGNTNYLQNQIFIAENHELTNNGVIDISGQICGGGGGYKVNSMTAGNHAQINLYNGSKILNNSTLNCYGFINDKSTSTQNPAEVQSLKGTTTVMFTVVENRGGSFFFGMIDPTGASNDEITSKAQAGANLNLEEGETPKNVGKLDATKYLQTAPFNRFYVESINCKFTIDAQSSLIGHVDLYANNDHNKTNVTLISAAEGSLIRLTESTSYVVNDFEPQTKKHTLNIYGSMSLSPLSITLSVTKTASIATVAMEVTLSTANVLFAISNHFDIILNSIASNDNLVDLTDQKVKLLPGSNLTIGTGVTVNADSIAVYNDNSLLQTSGASSGHNYTNNTPANLIVNGTLNVVNLGGNVQQNGSNAHLKITGNNYVVSKEMKTATSTDQKAVITVYSIYSAELPYRGITYYPDSACSLTATGDSTNGTTLKNNATAGTYYVYNNKWCPELITVTLMPNGGSVSTNSKSLNSGTAIQESALPTPTRDNYDFVGWYTTENCTDGTEFIFNQSSYSDITLYAKWNKTITNIIITYLNEDGTTIKTITLEEGASHTIETAPEKAESLANWGSSKQVISSAFKGWKINTSTNYYNAGDSVTPTDDLTLQATYTDTTTQYYLLTISATDATATIKINNSSGVFRNADGSVNSSSSVTSNIYVSHGTNINISYKPGTLKELKTTDPAAGDYTITADTKITVTAESSICIVEGTLITLADGTQKKVEDLQIGDMLMVFNHYTGKYDAKPLALNSHANDTAQLYNILNVQFSNGTLWRIAGTHGIYDCTLNKYVMISEENINEYVGHQFYYTDGQVGSKVTLTNYFVTKEFVKVFSPVTFEYQNYFANGLLNAPPLPNSYTAGQMNYFDFDENMMYNEEKMQADIEKYGLFTYEDFKDYIPEEVFDIIPFKYLKIAIGKGLITWEEIIAGINMLGA